MRGERRGAVGCGGERCGEYIGKRVCSCESSDGGGGKARVRDTEKGEGVVRGEGVEARWIS